MYCKRFLFFSDDSSRIYYTDLEKESKGSGRVRVFGNIRKESDINRLQNGYNVNIYNTCSIQGNRVNVAIAIVTYINWSVSVETGIIIRKGIYKFLVFSSKFG